jgi:hypothetical protein
MRHGVPAAGLIDVKANHLLADRALGDQGMKPPSAEKLEELQTPYDQVPHSRCPAIRTSTPPHWNFIEAASLVIPHRIRARTIAGGEFTRD